MSEYAVRINDLCKEYRVFKKNGQRFRGYLFNSKKGVVKKALTDISLDVRKGECVAVVGNVGSGRTTLAKIIAGLSFPTSGEVTVNGKVTSMFDLRAGFDLELSGRENILVKGGMLGWTGKEIKEREKAVIEYAQMEKIIDHPMKSYQQGMGARLGFAMLTVEKPEILVIDNPLIAGDRVFREKMIKTLEEYARDENITIILVSNDIMLTKRLCSRAVVMEKGCIEFEGKPGDAIAYYREHFRKNVTENVRTENDSYSQGDDFDDDTDFDF